MPKLKCVASKCAYNNDQHCYRSAIDIEGPMARSKKETACLSYVKKGNIAYDVEFAKMGEAPKETFVYCDASNCVFEHDARCHADKIEIKDIETADQKHQDLESKYHNGYWKNASTMCKTFETRE